MSLDKYIERLKPKCNDCGGRGKYADILQSSTVIKPCPSCNEGIQPIDQPALILDIVGNLVDARRAFEIGDSSRLEKYIYEIENDYHEKAAFVLYIKDSYQHHLALALKNLLILCGAVGVAITIDIPADVGSTLDEAFLYMIGDIENIRAHEYEKTYIIILYHRLNSFATHHGIYLIKHLDALLEGEKGG